MPGIPFFSAAVFLFAWLPAVMGEVPQELERLSLPPETRQVVLVMAADCTSRAGSLRRFERSRFSAGWRARAPSHPVVLGRNGLAWGLGLHILPEGAPVKQEGDGKGPIGIFRLGIAFGEAAAPVPGSVWPYRQATDRDFFVDDPESPDYNRWVTLGTGAPEARWSSFERMRRTDDLYRLGVVVEHNVSPPVAGHGSAIFLHLWKGPDHPTSGCTAMAEADLLELVQWLRPEANPLFVQVSEPDLARLRMRRGPEFSAAKS